MWVMNNLLHKTIWRAPTISGRRINQGLDNKEIKKTSSFKRFLQDQGGSEKLRQSALNTLDSINHTQCFNHS